MTEQVFRNVTTAIFTFEILRAQEVNPRRRNCNNTKQFSRESEPMREMSKGKNISKGHVPEGV